jgi:hypothetical protein
MLVVAALVLAAADPVPPTPARETSVRAAVLVVRDYYAALSRRDYRAAYKLWHGTQNYAHFRQGYAATRRVRVTFLTPGTPEGAAGSIYIDIPVRLDAVLRSGVQHVSWEATRCAG